MPVHFNQLTNLSLMLVKETAITVKTAYHVGLAVGRVILFKTFKPTTFTNTKQIALYKVFVSVSVFITAFLLN